MGNAQTNFRAEDMPGNSGGEPQKAATETPEPTPETSSEEQSSIPADTAPKKGTTKGAPRRKAAAPTEESTHEYTVQRDGDTIIEAEGVENNG